MLRCCCLVESWILYLIGSKAKQSTHLSTKAEPVQVQRRTFLLLYMPLDFRIHSKWKQTYFPCRKPPLTILHSGIVFLHNTMAVCPKDNYYLLYLSLTCPCKQMVMILQNKVLAGSYSPLQNSCAFKFSLFASIQNLIQNITKLKDRLLYETTIYT